MQNEIPMKMIVKNGYESGRYLERFRKNHNLSSTEKLMIGNFVSCLSKGKTITDLGCGSGQPYNEIFIENELNVIGVDISKKHIHQARSRIKRATYIESDISDFVKQQKECSVDGYSAFYSLFHLPKSEQIDFLQNVYRSLKNEGVFLATFGTPLTQNLKKEFCGSMMAWEGFKVDEYKEITKSIGFSITHEMFQSHDDDKENHFWMLLEKRSSCKPS